MKVLQIITRVNQGGTARWLEKLALELTSPDWESVLVAGVVGKNEIEDACFEKLQGIRVHQLGKDKGPLKDFLALIELRKLLKKHNPDVVNTHTSKAGVLGRIAVSTIRNKNIRLIHTFHGHLLYGYFSKPLTTLIILIEKFMSRFTHQYIVAGKTVRDQLIEVGIGDNRKYSIIYPGVSTPVKLDSQIIRRKYGIPQESIVVGWMGRFESIKAPFRVLELAEHFPKMVFLMAGSGSLFETVKSMAPSNLILPGWSDANEIWSISDIALLTSENEALPIALIEAGLNGIPSVAEHVGSVSEVVLDEQTGYLCNSFEQREQALSNLSRDSHLRTEMGKKANIHCSSSFSLENFRKNHILAYLGKSTDEIG
jgi:glycosyltransferase involved in cell wall biosynthesis